MSQTMKKHFKFTDGQERVIFDENDQPGIKKAFLDGYIIGDRLLEGVDFTIELDDDGLGITVSVDPRFHHYMSKLNAERFIDAAAEYVEKRADALSPKIGGGDFDYFIGLKEPKQAPGVKP